MKNKIRDVEKSLSNMGKSTFREISTKYETVFAGRLENKQDVQCGSRIL